jgi:hypothetical protein
VPPARLPESITAPLPKAEPPIAATSLPAVTLHVVARDDAVEVGGETVYEVRVLNQGNAPGTDVQIAAAVGEGMALLAAEGPARREVQGREVIFEPLPSLDARGRAVYHVRARGVTPGRWRFKVYLQAGQMQRPVSQEVVTEVYSDQAPGAAAPRREPGKE